MIDLNHSQNLAVRRRAGWFHVPLLLPVLVTALERQSLFLFGWLLLVTPVAVQAQFTYMTNNGSITITGFPLAYSGPVNIPSKINDLPVTSIEANAFSHCVG